jgi:hypothetical protein
MSRTQIPLVIQPPLGMADANSIEGVVAKTEQFSITTDADTTAVIYMAGLIPWRLHNESGGAVTVTLYDAGEKDGAELTIYDVDNQPIAAFSVADGGSVDISDAAGVLHLVIKGGAAASGLRLVAKR